MNPPLRQGRLAAAAAWAGLIAYLTLAPLPYLPPLPPFDLSDKLLHALFYVPLGALAVSAFRRPSPPTLLAILLLVTGYGLALEVGQLYVPGRYFEMLDGVANAVGAGAGVGLVRLAARRKAAADLPA